MKVIRVLDSTGDSRHEFDVTDAKATEEAKALFDRLVGDQGYAAFRIAKNEGEHQQIKRFEETGEETILARFAGG